MARFLAWADLHDEFWRSPPRIPETSLDVDGLILAGDTSTRGRHLDVALGLWEQLRKPVVLLYGNHEFYGSRMDQIKARDQKRLEELRASGADVRILDGESTEIAGTRIIGATLWTDLDLFPGYAQPTRTAVSRGMNDMVYIETTKGKTFKIEDWLEMHWSDRKAILDLAAVPFNGPTLMVTHHMPVKEMIHPLRTVGRIERQLLNAAFAADMGDDLRKIDVDAWFCGHSHDNRCATVPGLSAPIEIMTNSRGYPKEGCEFDPGFTIETEARPSEPHP